MFLTKLLLIFGFVAYMGCSVNSLQCYICDESSPNFKNNCDDDSLEEHELKALIKDCKDVEQIIPPMVNNARLTPTGCVEYIAQKLKPVLPNASDPNDDKLTIRSCYFGNIDDAEKNCDVDTNKFRNFNFGEEIECTVCEGDLCNGSAINNPILFGVLFASLIAYFTSKFI